jgi:hypothetical protein
LIKFDKLKHEKLSSNRPRAENLIHKKHYQTMSEYLEDFDERVDYVTDVLNRTVDRLEESNLVSVLALFQCVVQLCKDEPREDLESLFRMAHEMCLTLKGNA